VTLALVAIILCCQSCIPGLYTFSGTSFDPNIETFFVFPFDLEARSAPPTLAQNVEEALKLKIRQESRLQQLDTDPDIEFKGTITRFNVSLQAPEAGEAIGFNRLTISVKIDYIDNYHGDEEYNWSQTFTRFEDFGANDNLLNVQDGLIELITEQLIEDIFNRAFSDW
jgi:hypothetical protein